MPYKIGDLLLRSSTFSHALDASFRKTVCDHCLSQSESHLSKCSGCSVIYYCSQKCQSSSWKKIHKHECKYMRMLGSTLPPATLLFILRTLCVLRSGGDVMEADLPSGYPQRRFRNLMSHKDDVLKDPVRKEAFFTYFTLLKNKIGDALDIEEAEILDIFSKILINSGHLYTEDFLSVGVFLSLSFSCLDHSCRPNVSVSFIGSEVFVKVVESLESLGDARVSYIDVLQPTHIRKQLLREQFYFECDCEECTSDPRGLNDLKLRSPRCVHCGSRIEERCCLSCKKGGVSDHYSRLKKLSVHPEDVNLIRSVFKEFINYVHPYDHLSIQYSNILLSKCPDLSDNEKAILIERRLLASNKYSGEFDVETLVSILDLTYLSISNDIYKTETVRHVQKAVKAMNIALPQAHPILKVMNQVFSSYLESANKFNDGIYL